MGPGGPAFSGAPSRTDWLVVNLMQGYQLQGYNLLAGTLAEAVGTSFVTAFDRTFSTPAMVVCETDDFWLVSFEGTNTPQQWVLHVLGSFQVPWAVLHPSPVPRFDGAVNSYFLEVCIQGGAPSVISDPRYPQLVQTLGPTPNSKRIVLVGHSFGAAMAQVCANLLTNAGYTNIGVYVAASPKVGDAAFAAAVAPFTHRLEDFEDPVVALPPDTFVGLTNWFGFPIPGVATYVHGGSAETLHPNGDIDPGSSPIPLPEAAALLAGSPTVFAANHVAPTYTARLAKQWGPEYRTPGAYGYAHPDVIERALGLTPVVVVPAGVPPLPEPTPAPDPIGALLMAFPGANAPPGFRFIMRFNSGIYGWTETYYFWYAALDATIWARAQADAARLATARKSILTANASLWAYRVQQWGDGKAGSEFVTDTGRGCGPGIAVDTLPGGEPVWDGVICDLYDATYTYRRSLILRGLPSQYVQWQVNGTAALKPPGDGLVATFIQVAMGANSKLGADAGITGKGSIYGREKDPTKNGSETILTASLNPSGCGTDVTVVGTFATQPGKQVHIHQAGACGDLCSVPGMSGDSCVHNVVANVGPPSTTTVTVGLRPCCCLPGTDIRLPPGSQLYRIIPGFYDISAQETGRLVKRDTGGASGAGRGRARACSRR